jgi:hypothetical protein
VTPAPAVAPAEPVRIAPIEEAPPEQAPAQVIAAMPAQVIAPAPAYQKLPTLPMAWILMTLLGVVILGLLGETGYLYFHKGKPQVAARSTVLPKPPAGAVPAESPARKEVASVPHAGPGRAALKAPGERGLPRVAEHRAVGAPLGGARAKQEPALPQPAGGLPSNPQPTSARTTGAPGGQVAAPSAPGAVARNLPSQPAQPAPQPPPSPATGVAAGPQAPPEARKTPTGRTPNTELVARPSRSPSPGAASTGAAVAGEHPPSLRLEPDAHLLLALSSVNPLPDGSLQFRGTLLLPVVHAAAVPLDQGAGVIGAMRMSQGQISLAVTDLVIQGTRYTLRVGNGAMKAQTPGAGGTVQLDRSQVLEMWPASPSVYEKAPDTTPQPEPRK